MRDFNLNSGNKNLRILKRTRLFCLLICFRFGKVKHNIFKSNSLLINAITIKNQHVTSTVLLVLIIHYLKAEAGWRKCLLIYNCLSVGCLMSVNPEVNQTSMTEHFGKNIFENIICKKFHYRCLKRSWIHLYQLGKVKKTAMQLKYQGN